MIMDNLLDVEAQYRASADKAVLNDAARACFPYFISKTQKMDLAIERLMVAKAVAAETDDHNEIVSYLTQAETLTMAAKQGLPIMVVIPDA